MSRGYSVPVLHQQDGGLSLQAFAEREGLTLVQVMRCIKRGKVLGARQDARSKHWWIYPPAKLLERPRSYQRRVALPEPVEAGNLVIAPAEQVPLLTSRVNTRFVYRRIRLGSEADITMFQVRRVGVIRALRLTGETPLVRGTSIELSYAYQDAVSLPLMRRLQARLTRVVRLSRTRE